MNLPDPSLQIAFALSLRTARGKILQTVLMDTVKTLPVSTIDQEPTLWRGSMPGFQAEGRR